MPDDSVQQTAVAPAKIALAPVIDSGEFSELLDSNRFAQIQRVAKLFSESDLVPEVFQGKPANCAVALQMAFRMRIDPMMLMQNMYIVYGRPGIEAKLAIALMNQRGPFEGPVQWKVTGDGDARAWTAYATHKGTGEKCEATVTWSMVKAEGWLDKKGSKWQSIPDLMGRYRSAMFLGRLYCPEVLLGLPTDDELYDVGRQTRDVTPIVEPIAMPRAVDEPAPALTDIDPETGETSAPKRETKPAPAETKAEPSSRSATGSAEGAAPASGGDLLDGDNDAMNKRASEAQKNAILRVAKRSGLNGAQLDEKLVERFAIGLDELPVGLVNDALQFANSLKA